MIEGFEVLFHGRKVEGLVSVQEFKGGVLVIGVVPGVVSEFDEGERVGPGFGVDRAKDREVRFDFLIDPFGCSIRLRVESGRGGAFDSHQVEAGLEAFGHELGVSVRDDLVQVTEPSKELLEDEIACLLGQDGLLARREDDPLGEAMVNDD
jgi:hypothetical protein